MKTLRLTAAQATVRFLAAQMTEIDGETVPLFAGVFAIFGHGNVAGLGEALYGVRDVLPTFRAHNEQAMALAAIAFAKASRRQRMMACTTSIGPGATNMVTAAARRARQPLAGAAAAGRRLRQPPARPGVAAGRGFRRRRGERQRLLPPGLPLFRPHRAPRADRARPDARDGGVDGPGRMRPGDARLLSGRAGRGLRLSRVVLRQARASPAAPGTGRARTRRGGRGSARGEEAARRLRRRRALFPGGTGADGVLREAWRFRSPRRRPANRRRRPTIPFISARSASPEPAPPTRAPKKPTSCWRSARASPISPPGPGRCSRIPSAASSASTSSRSTPQSTARCPW